MTKWFKIDCHAVQSACNDEVSGIDEQTLVEEAKDSERFNLTIIEEANVVAII